MGFLFYADALGMQALLEQAPSRAATALRQITVMAKFCADRYMPGTSTPIRRSSDGKLVVFNDSVFYYSPSFPEVVQFASQLAYNLFTMPENKGGSIAIRGSIIKTEHHPRIDVEQDGSFFNASRLIVDQIGAALVADKRRVLGARIIVPRALVEESYAELDYRLQAKIFHLIGLQESFKGNILNLEKDLEVYCDIAWMNVESTTRFHTLRPRLDDFGYRASFDQRAALHAAATMALYRATDSRRRQIVVILQKLWAGVAKQLGGRTVLPEKRDYSAWMRLAPKIRDMRGGDLVFPLDVRRLTLA